MNVDRARQDLSDAKTALIAVEASLPHEMTGLSLDRAEGLLATLDEAALRARRFVQALRRVERAQQAALRAEWADGEPTADPAKKWGALG